MLPLRAASAAIAACVCVVLPAQAQDDRPIHAYAALPAVGTALPEFMYPLLSGGTVTPASLRGTPAVLAFWATTCGGSRAVIGDIQMLASTYGRKGVRVIILADDGAAALRKYFGEHHVQAEVAEASDVLSSAFDRSATAPERATLRVEWALPLWLVVDAEGKVAFRGGGPNEALAIAAVVDSLLAQPD